jgi:hypothetical protein
MMMTLIKQAIDASILTFNAHAEQSVTDVNPEMTISSSTPPISSNPQVPELQQQMSTTPENLPELSRTSTPFAHRLLGPPLTSRMVSLTHAVDSVIQEANLFDPSPDGGGPVIDASQGYELLRGNAHHATASTVPSNTGSQMAVSSENNDKDQEESHPDQEFPLGRLSDQYGGFSQPPFLPGTTMVTNIEELFLEGLDSTYGLS